MHQGSVHMDLSKNIFFWLFLLSLTFNGLVTTKFLAYINGSRTYQSAELASIPQKTIESDSQGDTDRQPGIQDTSAASASTSDSDTSARIRKVAVLAGRSEIFSIIPETPDTFHIRFSFLGDLDIDNFSDLIAVRSLGEKVVETSLKKVSRNGNIGILTVTHQPDDTQFSVECLVFRDNVYSREENEIDVATSLHISRPSGRYNQPEYVNIPANFPIDTENASKFIEIKPDVKYRISHSESGRQYLVIVGEFEENSYYNINFKKGLPSLAGFKLDEDLSYIFKTGESNPRLDILTSGPYFPAGRDMVLPVATQKISELSISTVRIHPQNVIHFLRNSYSEEEYGEEIDSRSVPVDKDYSNSSPLYVRPFENGVKPESGVYKISVKDSTEHDDSSGYRWYYRQSEDRIVVISDLALQVSVVENQYRVWVTSLKTRKPVNNVNVSLYTYQFDEVISGISNQKGLVHLVIPPDKAHRQIHAVMAQLGNDRTLMRIEYENLTELPGKSQSGGRAVSQDQFDAFIYSERDIYRPGDNIFWGGIVRKPSGAPLDTGVPVAWSFKKSGDQSILDTGIATMDEFGHLEGELALSPSLPVGSYHLIVHTPGDLNTRIGHKSLTVRFFEPQVIKANFTRKLAEFHTSESDYLNSRLQVQYLFGKPAEGLECKVKITKLPPDWNGQWPDGYTVRDSRHAGDYLQSVITSAISDAEGNVDISMRIPEGWSQDLFFKLRMDVTISDGRGGTLILSDSSQFYNNATLIGIRPISRPSEGLQLAWKSLSPDGQSQNLGRTLNWACHAISYTYQPVLSDTGRMQWRAVRKLSEVANGQLTDGDSHEGHLALGQQPTGRYLLHFSNPDNARIIQSIEFSHGSNTTENSTNETLPYGTVDLQIPNREFIQGETINLHMESPVSGVARLDIYTNQLTHSEVVEVNAGGNDFPVQIPDTLHGSVYVTATVLTSPEDLRESRHAERLQGMIYIPVRQNDRKLEIDIDVAGELEPGQAVDMPIALTSVGKPVPGIVHIFAVDMGIHAISNYKSPPVHEWFHGKKTFSGRYYDIFDNLFPDHEKLFGGYNKSDIGGGVGGAFINPFSRSLDEMAVLELGKFAVDESGTTSVRFDVPNLEGTLNILAIAAGSGKAGSTIKPIVVRSPVSLLAGIPQRLVPGDRFYVTGSLTSHLDQRISASLELGLQGISHVQDVNGHPYVYEVGENESVQFAIPLQADEGYAGNGRVSISLKHGNNVISTKSLNTSIRPAAGRLYSYETIQVEPGETLERTIHSGYMPSTSRISLDVNGTAAGSIHAALRWLESYPYGCLEQSVSGAWPLLYTKAFSHPAEKVDESMNITKIRELLTSLEFQFWTGDGFSMWRGNRTSDDVWVAGSLYAAHFIAEAQRKGVSVAPAFLENLLSWLREKSDFYQYSSPAEMERVTYAVYIRSLLGDVSTRFLQALSRDSSIEGMSRILLAGALDISGDRGMAQQLTSGIALSQLVSNPHLDGNTHNNVLDTPIRRLGICLGILARIDPDRPHVQKILNYFEDSRSDRGDWGTTINNAAVALGAGQYFELAGPPAAPEGSVVFGSAAPIKFGNNQSISHTVDRSSIDIRITNTGHESLALNIIKSGFQISSDEVNREVPEADSDTTSSLLRLSRVYLHEQKKPLNEWKPGDLIDVRIQISALPELDNIALVDLLPGCLDFESGIDIQSTNFSIESTDIREDRIIIFGSMQHLPDAEISFSCRVRSPGDYAIPELFGESMYNPAMQASFKSAERLQIQPSQPLESL